MPIPPFGAPPTPDATSSKKGKVKLIGDLGGTADAPTVPGLALKVTGPSSSVDNAITRFDGTTGKIIQDYTSNAPTVDDTGVMTLNGGSTGANSLISAFNASFWGGRFILGSVGGNAGQTIGLDASPISIYRKATNQLGIKNVTSGVQVDDGPLIIAVAGDKTTLQLVSSGNNTGLTIGTDTNLYRSAANTLKTDDDLVLGAGQVNARTATAISYTILTTDYIIGVTSTASVRTLTLPTVAAAGIGRTYVIKDESGLCGTNSITIDGNGSETIDGALTYVMNVNYQSVTLYCTGAAWMVV